MRQYTVTIRCMFDVTEEEINYWFVIALTFQSTVVARLGRASPFCGTATLDLVAI